MKTFADFQAQFPELYRDVRCGWSCPDGWLEIVWRLSEQLEPLGIECDQVKEKFGGLRFYLKNPAVGLPKERLKDAYAAIHEAEEAADHTCELCGKPGKLGKFTKHYVRVLCADHTPPDVEQDVPAILTNEQFDWESALAPGKKEEP